MLTFRLGAATISSINVGNFGFRLKDVDNVPKSEWREKYSDVFENIRPYPSQSFLITLRNLIVLIDPGDYASFASLSPENVIPGYSPPPSLTSQLRKLGVRESDVNYVVITHGHVDHYAGVATFIANSGESVPTFPRALHMIGKQDFESQGVQISLRDRSSIERKTIGMLLEKGLLELVEKGRELSDEIEIIEAPGETPGHKIVRLESNGEVLYCVGDLFHHSSEVENVSWMAKWADAEKNLESRKLLIERALKENALVAASHMPLGRLRKDGSAIKFVLDETIS
jgi:glyoxylase-like metal-dependent hydrolase (beta-lactamase superfamily II)